jgi:hypothetical protein
MIIKVELYHSSTGWFAISNPDGWPDAKLGFERHEEAFHCLIEYFRSAFRTYGSNGIDDGGREKIKIIERDFGPSTYLGLRVKIKETENDVFEEFYNGKIPVIDLTETIDEEHTLGLTFEQNDTQAKFMSRLNQKINIRSATSIDGVAVDVIDPIMLPMPSQIIGKRHTSALDAGLVLSGPWTGTGIPPGGRTITTQFDNQWLQFGFLPDQQEISRVFDLIIDLNTTLPAEYIYPEEGGEYHITSRILVGIIAGNELFLVPSGDRVYATNTFDWVDEGNNVRDILHFFYQINNESPVEFNATTRGIPISTSPSNTSMSAFDLDVTLTLNPFKDVVRIFGKFSDEFTVGSISTNDGIGMVMYGQDNSNIDLSPMNGAIFGDTVNLGVPMTGSGTAYSYLNVEAATVYPETVCPVFLQHDIARLIIDRICDQNNTLVSEFLGNPSTSPSYEDYGDASRNAGALGMHIRGYTIDEKILSMTFKQWWEGMNAHYNLSLSFVRDSITGRVTVHIGKKADQYRIDLYSVTINNVRKVGKSYDKDHYYNSFRIGSQQWESGDLSGLDDPQSEHTYGAKQSDVDNEFEQLSPMVTASYAIENTRRSRKEKSADYKFDNDIFLISLIEMAGDWLPETDERVNSISGLKFPESRYNIRHTPARMLRRWLDYLSGQMQYAPAAAFSFQGGEGNYDMISTLQLGDRDDFGSVNEKADVDASSDFLFIPRLFTFNTAITLDQYKLIRAHPEYSIRFSQTEKNHIPMLIKDLEFTPLTGDATFKCWAKQWVDLQVIQDETNEVPILGCVFDAKFDETFCE